MEIKLIDVAYCNIKINLSLNSNSITTIIDDFDDLKISDLLTKKIKYSGNVTIDGKSLKDKKVRIADEIATSSNSENFGLFNINILEDLKYNNKTFNEDLLNDYIQKYQIDKNTLSKNYTEISMGEKKKISLIYTFMSDKKILIFENPTSYLDNKAKEQFIKELKRIKREGKIIIIVTNDSNLALKVSDRIVLIHNKKSVLYNDKYSCFLSKEAKTKYKLEMPKIIEFINKVNKLKEIKLHFRDDINETIKDVYRNVNKYSK